MCKIRERTYPFAALCNWIIFKDLSNSIKVAYTSGPFFEKIMKRYPIFSLQIYFY